MVKKLLERLMKKNCKKQIKKDLGQKNKSWKKETSYMSNGKDIIIRLISALIKEA